MRGGKHLANEEAAKYREFIDLENLVIEDLQAAGYTLKAALDVVGLGKSTWHYRHHPRPSTARDGHAVHPRWFTDDERGDIAALILEEKQAGKSIYQCFYDHLDDPHQPYLGSLRTFYRVAATLTASTPRRVTGKKQSAIPVVHADRPGQVLCWDITFLPASFMSKGWHLYTVLDLYSRKIVGWSIQQRQEESIANRLIQGVITELSLQDKHVKVVHTDNGAVMTSNSMKTMLDDNGVALSLIRPSVSNDNPFEESSHRTVKHHRLAKEIYPTIEDANTTISAIIECYNNRDHHSGLAGFTPSQVFDGTWQNILAQRIEKLRTYYQRQPMRRPAQYMFRPPATRVGINIGKQQQEQLPEHYQQQLALVAV